MLKKLVVLTFTLCFLLVFSTSVFATNNNSIIGNVVNDAKNTISDGANNIRNVVEDGSNALKNTTEDMANDVRDGANNVENSIANGVNTVTNDAINTSEDAGYTATRTATSNNNLLGMSDTTWTWLILGIVGAVIVALVWYYGAQYEHRNYNND